MMTDPVDLRRVLARGAARPDTDGLIIYWMSRDQRVAHNWALLHAQNLAHEIGNRLAVLFTLAPSFLEAPYRHYDFMLRSLESVDRKLRDRGIPFVLLQGNPEESLPGFLFRHAVRAVVADFSPLRLHRQWQQHAAASTGLPFHVVDTHNCVPCWCASQRQEFAARTFRPRINAQLDGFLTPFPELQSQKDAPDFPPTDWEAIRAASEADRSIPPITWLEPGEDEAHATLDRFIATGLDHYASGRNDPNAMATSTLSPYLHFGQISAQFIARRIAAADAPPESVAAFLEELIVRKELSDNYCAMNQAYDSFDTLPEWARNTLARHAADQREYCYDAATFEQAATHEPLWNAAQLELRQRGIIHGYMRMYWAKKILEWSASPRTAYATAIMLNDRYAIDGRDPNGYTGIAWAIGGLHDRPWADRSVFGTIRYMNARGCGRKFDTRAYINRNCC